MAHEKSQINAWAVFRYFFKLGSTGFGGPLAIISILQKDLIEKEKWMPTEKFQSTLAVIKAMPGPVAFQSSVYLGFYRYGLKGAFAAALGLLIVPFLMMIAFAEYLNHSEIAKQMAPVLVGLQIGAVVVMTLALKPLIRGFEKSYPFWTYFVTVLPLTWFYAQWEPLLIVGFGLLAVISKKKIKWCLALVAITFFSIHFTYASEIAQLAWVNLKAGTFVFGTGLAIVPMLKEDVVTRLGWMTAEEFLTAVAIGQVTPGPVVITATYIGYKVYGWLGAIVATICVFGSSFFHMTTWFPKVINKLIKASWVRSFTEGALSTVLATIVCALVKLCMEMHWELTHILTAILIFVLGYKFIHASWKLIPLSGVIYLAFYYSQQLL